MTTYGLRIRNASGTVVFDTGSGAARLLGYQNTAANVSGSYSNPLFKTAKPFYVRYLTSLAAGANFFGLPVISYDGNQTVSWTAADNTSYLLYGVYASNSAIDLTQAPKGYGLRVHNSNGDIQIDGAQPNLFFISKQAININENAQLSVNINAVYPIIAYRGTGTLAVVTMTSTGTNTWTALLAGDSGVNTVGTIYIFDIASRGVTDGSTYGLRVRNSSGQVIFDSRVPVGKIISDGAISTNPTVQTTVALSQNNLAVIVSPGYSLTKGS